MVHDGGNDDTFVLFIEKYEKLPDATKTDGHVEVAEYTSHDAHHLLREMQPLPQTYSCAVYARHGRRGLK